MTEPELMNQRFIAENLGVVPSAVSNWVARGVLPPELRPRMVKGAAGALYGIVWDRAVLGRFILWYNERHDG